MLISGKNIFPCSQRNVHIRKGYVLLFLTKYSHPIVGMVGANDNGCKGIIRKKIPQYDLYLKIIKFKGYKR